MSDSIVCEHCQARIRVPEGFHKTRVRCPKCKELFEVRQGTESHAKSRRPPKRNPAAPEADPLLARLQTMVKTGWVSLRQNLSDDPRLMALAVITPLLILIGCLIALMFSQRAEKVNLAKQAEPFRRYCNYKASYTGEKFTAPFFVVLDGGDGNVLDRPGESRWLHGVERVEDATTVVFLQRKTLRSVKERYYMKDVKTGARESLLPFQRDDVTDTVAACFIDRKNPARTCALQESLYWVYDERTDGDQRSMTERRWSELEDKIFKQAKEPSKGVVDTLARLQGTWVYVQQTVAGKEIPAEQMARHWEVIQGDSVAHHFLFVPQTFARRLVPNADGSAMVVTHAPVDGKEEDVVTSLSRLILDEARTPKQLDLELIGGKDVEKGSSKRGQKNLGIYKLEDDTLTWCWDQPGKNRPTSFDSTPGSTTVLTILRRQLAKTD